MEPRRILKEMDLVPILPVPFAGGQAAAASLRSGKMTSIPSAEGGGGGAGANNGDGE